EGMSPFEAAIKGANEIFFAVISISVTLAAVFLPVIFLEGFVGRLFREFGIVIGAAVMISAFVSLTLTPMLNAYLIKGTSKSKFYVKTEPFFQGLNDGFHDYLEKFLKKRWLAFPILITCIGLIVLFWKILPKETAPLDDRSSLSLNITAPEGSSFAYTDAFVSKVGELVRDSIPEKSADLSVTAPGFSGSGAANTAFFRVKLKEPSERERSQDDIANYLTKNLKKLNEAKAFAIQQPTISVGRSRGLPIQYIIQAPNFEKLQEKIPAFMDQISKDPTFTNTDVNLKFNKPELNVSIDRDKAQSLGVSVKDVAQTLQLSLSEQRFAYFTMSGKQYQVIGQLDRDKRNDPYDLSAIFVRNKMGKLIQLDNLVKVVEKSSPPQRYRNNRFSSATVSGGLAPGKTIGDGIAAMERAKDKILDDTFSTDLAGESRDFSESNSNTTFAFGLALLLVYLILAAQFESFVDPVIIILTVPMAVAGAFFSLWLLGQSWNIFSQIGTIMLIGLVTKNGILIVEFANQLKERGMPVAEAIREATVSRLRPILMTSLAIALGALPIAMALGAASKSRMSMGTVIIGGTLFSLLLTLFVIPAIYSYWSKEYHETRAEKADKEIRRAEKES
ncbi:MAG: efflux RND transporter permease subunit, partial [Bacteroidetes bacterium]|nr:efflux RND transporter permease subunit [Bacteroidota bacterium]